MKTISPAHLKELVDKKDVILIDVREKEEREAQRIEEDGLQCIAIPFGEINPDMIPKGEKPVVLYCKLGKRSTVACEKLHKEAPCLSNISVLEGGIDSWIAAGYPVVGKGFSKKLKLPVEQQVQIIVGSLALLGIILGWLISPWFLLLSAFLSVGLICTGLSGWCGMHIFLLKMPWNR